MSVLICISGLPGTGKTTLSKAIATAYQAYHLELDSYKKQVYSADPQYEEKLAQGIPFSDELRKQAFDQGIQALSNLKKLPDHVVVDEVFPTHILREYFYAQVKHSFKTLVVVWIQSDEAMIHARLMQQRADHMLKNSWSMYLNLKKIFEPVQEADIVYNNIYSIEIARVELAERIQQVLKQK